jgi:hypothetical protein
MLNNTACRHEKTGCSETRRIMTIRLRTMMRSYQVCPIFGWLSVFKLAVMQKTQNGAAMHGGNAAT